MKKLTFLASVILLCLGTTTAQKKCVQIVLVSTQGGNPVINQIDTSNPSKTVSLYGGWGKINYINPTGPSTQFSYENTATLNRVSAGDIHFSSKISSITSHCYDNGTELFSAFLFDSVSTAGMFSSIFSKNTATNKLVVVPIIKFDEAPRIIAPLSNNHYVIAGDSYAAQDKNGVVNGGSFVLWDKVAQTLTPYGNGLSSRYRNHSIGIDKTVVINCERDFHVLYYGQTGLMDALYPPLPSDGTTWQIYCVDKAHMYAYWQSNESPYESQVLGLDFINWQWIPIIIPGMKSTNNFTQASQKCISSISGIGTKLLITGTFDSLKHTATSHVAEYDLVTKAVTSDPEPKPRSYDVDFTQVSLQTTAGRIFLIDATQTVSGLTSLYELTGDALPLTLTSFSAIKNGKDVDLDWTTAQELNTHHFAIERSTDAIAFDSIAVIAAAGNSSLEKKYQYIDHLSIGNSYYRLKMVDKDGAYTFSPIQVVKNETDITQVRLYPNPAHDWITLEMPTQDVFGTLSIIDVNGRIVLRSTIQRRGFTNRTVDVSLLKPGVYILFLQKNTGETVSIKFPKL